MALSGHELVVNNLEHLSVSRSSENDELNRNYNPQEIIPSPSSSKLIIADEIPIIHRTPETSYEDKHIENHSREWYEDCIIQHKNSEY